MRSILVSILFNILTFACIAQNVPVHPLHISIYDFMDELAKDKVIEINFLTIWE